MQLILLRNKGHSGVNDVINTGIIGACSEHLQQLNYFDDFAKMSACDYVISSPSTFCICSAMIGKQTHVIHSKEWINNRVEAQDKFWLDLSNSGNEDYSIWRLI